MRYEGIVYRPPSEAYSLIVQATIGCSHNKCTFCSMYKDKQFRIRPLEDVLQDFSAARQRYSNIGKVFLADGDALIRKTEDLVAILDYIRDAIPECTSVTTYGSPRSIHLKSAEDLTLLHRKGLRMIYLGLESGSDAILSQIKKGETADEIVAAGQKVKEAGILLSVTAISGLGGTTRWREHAEQTGRALSRMHPDYIGLLTLMLEQGTPLYEQWMAGNFDLLTPEEVMQETLVVLENLDSEGSVFRMNHASNYLTLRGTLNTDREAMMQKLRKGLEGSIRLRSESSRLL